MILKIETGDIFNAILNRDVVFMHGCNAKGVMGSGIAKIVKDNYPHAYRAYKEIQKTQGLHLGQVIVAAPSTENEPTIVNAITQENYGRDVNVKYADYDAIIIACEAVAKHFKGKEIHLPMIGGGLGNLDVKRLTAIYQAVFYDSDATLWLKEE